VGGKVEDREGRVRGMGEIGVRQKAVWRSGREEGKGGVGGGAGKEGAEDGGKEWDFGGRRDGARRGGRKGYRTGVGFPWRAISPMR